AVNNCSRIVDEESLGNVGADDLRHRLAGRTDARRAAFEVVSVGGDDVNQVAVEEVDGRRARLVAEVAGKTASGHLYLRAKTNEGRQQSRAALEDGIALGMRDEWNPAVELGAVERLFDHRRDVVRVELDEDVAAAGQRYDALAALQNLVHVVCEEVLRAEEET